MDFLSHMVFPFINFFIFLALLVWFARKPAYNFATKKADNFLEQKKRAQDIYKQASLDLDEAESRLSSIDLELNKIKEEYQKQIELKTSEIKEKAERQTQQIEKELQWMLDYNVAQAREKIKRELMMKVKEHLINKAQNLSSKEHGALLGKAEDKLKKLVVG